MSDDINDLGVMQIVGLSYCYLSAINSIKEIEKLIKADGGGDNI